MLQILQSPAPELSLSCANVEEFDESFLKSTFQEMVETMNYADGIGLAGSQVGIIKRLAVVKVNKDYLYLINPILKNHTGRQVNLEGCLSIPNQKIQVMRPRKVIIEYAGLDGQLKTIGLSGIHAACALHEMDHMDGITILKRSAFSLALPH